MNKKYVPFMCVSAFAVIAWLFLPFVSYYGVSVTMFDAIDQFGLGGSGTIFIIAAIAGGILGVIASFIQKKGLAVAGAWIGLLGVLGCLGSMGEEVDMDMVFEVLGMGFWLALVAYVVAVVLAHKIKKVDVTQNQSNWNPQQPQQNPWDQNQWPQGKTQNCRLRAAVLFCLHACKLQAGVI